MNQNNDNINNLRLQVQDCENRLTRLTHNARFEIFQQANQLRTLQRQHNDLHNTHNDLRNAYDHILHENDTLIIDCISNGLKQS